jgi:hypothetical protein
MQIRRPDARRVNARLLMHSVTRFWARRGGVCGFLGARLEVEKRGPLR